MSTDAYAAYPSSYEAPNVVSVAATDANDLRASFSNYGPTRVDLGAPGVNVYSTWAGDASRYASGTSMASPHVAGAAALLLGADPTSTPAQVAKRLLDGATTGVVRE